MNKNTQIIVLVVVLVLIVGGIVFALKWNNTPSMDQSGQPVASSTVTVTPGTNGSHSTTGVSSGTHPTPAQPKILYPTLSKISPASGATGTFVSIYGSGFDATSQVLIGTGAVSRVTVNSTGTMITFTMPDSIGAYCKAGQACPMYAMVLQPGTYQLSVENDTGPKSNTFPFVITAH